MTKELVNGMRLPPQLVVALENGGWTASGKHWKSVFPADLVAMPELYRLDVMRRETEHWRVSSDPAFLGVADESVAPGDLDPAKSVLIGDLQPEVMIALDYRSGANAPSVVYLNVEGRWTVVAQSFDEFWRCLTEGHN